MSLSRKDPKRIAKNKARRERWEKGDSPLQRAGRYLFNEESYRATKAENKAKKQIKKNKLKVTGSADKPGAVRAKEMAKSRIKSGKTIAQVQAENKKSMQAAARKKHDDFQKKHKRGKYRVSKK